MNKRFGNFVMFTAGAAIGSVVTWFIVKKRYAQIAQEEIDSVIETFNNCEQHVQEESTKEETVETTEENKDLTNYSDIISKEEYTPETKDDVDHTLGKPHVISPDDYGMFSDYKLVGLSYFTDGKLADGQGRILDIEKTIGKDSLDKAGEYQDDVVHVRNTKMKTDFEVVLEDCEYSDVFDEYE